MIAFLVALAAFLYLLREILFPFVLAAIIAYVCSKPVDWLTRRLPGPRWVWAVAVFIALLLIAAVFAYLAGPPLVQEINRIAGNLHKVLESFISKIIGGNSIHLFGSNITASQAADYTVNAMKTWFTQDGRMLMAAAMIFSSAFGIILMIVLLGYFLVDGPRVAKGVYWLVPPTYQPFASRAWHELNPVLWRYFLGVALVVIYASTAAYIGLGLGLGLKHAIVLALMTGFLEVIPVIGPAASAILAGLVAVQEAKSSAGIMVYIIYAIALRISIDEFFGPIVLGRAGKVPPVVVIFCFLAGGFLFGIVGVVLAVPAALTVRVILHVLYDESGPPREGPEEP
ncbi:MAG TPA: AI-2E family transporter [Pararhizobium sp.]|nr:AI-2E family transporter [Pararhizobium sp.]